MYKTNKPESTSIRRNESLPGESIEAKVRRIVENKEPIADGAEVVYTERKEGVLPQYNHRTDKWEHAVEAMGTLTKTALAERQNRIMEKEQGSEGKDKAE